MKILKMLKRIFVEPNDFEETICFYEDLFGERCSLRFKYDEVGLELAQVSSILIIAGSEQNLQKFRNTELTFIVDSLDDYFRCFTNKNILILEKPKDVPTGRNMRVKHPDGTVVEYVEHN